MVQTNSRGKKVTCSCTTDAQSQWDGGLQSLFTTLGHAIQHGIHAYLFMGQKHIDQHVSFTISVNGTELARS